MATKTGWWSVKFDLTLEGEEVRWDDLDEVTQEHIAEMIKEGYTSGEIVEEKEVLCRDCIYAGEENGRFFCNHADSPRFGEEIDGYSSCGDGEERD